MKERVTISAWPVGKSFITAGLSLERWVRIHWAERGDIIYLNSYSTLLLRHLSQSKLLMFKTKSLASHIPQLLPRVLHSSVNGKPIIPTGQTQTLGVFFDTLFLSYPVSQWMLLILPWKDIQNLTTSHHFHCYYPGLSPSSATCIIAVASKLASLLLPLSPTAYSPQSGWRDPSKTLVWSCHSYVQNLPLAF